MARYCIADICSASASASVFRIRFCLRLRVPFLQTFLCSAFASASVFRFVSRSVFRVPCSVFRVCAHSEHLIIPELQAPEDRIPPVQIAGWDRCLVPLQYETVWKRSCE